MFPFECFYFSNFCLCGHERIWKWKRKTYKIKNSEIKIILKFSYYWTAKPCYKHSVSIFSNKGYQNDDILKHVLNINVFAF